MEKIIYDGTVIEYIVQEAYEGSRKDLAKDLGVTQGLVCHWVKGIRKPSSKLAYQLESLTGVPTMDILFPHHMLEEKGVKRAR